MRKIKEMIFLDVTELSLTERFKPIEEKRKKGIIRKFKIPDGNQTDDFICTGWISRA